MLSVHTQVFTRSSNYAVICFVSLVRYINQRNRERNIKEAERAMAEEIKVLKHAEPDPFTRRHCRPTLVTKVSIWGLLPP